MKYTGWIIILGVTALTASAQATNAPEIDGSTAASGLALIVGGLLVLRSRRKK